MKNYTTIKNWKKSLVLPALLLISTGVFAQSGNHVFEGAEVVNFDTLDLATPGGQTWSTYRGATPGYFRGHVKNMGIRQTIWLI